MVDKQSSIYGDTGEEERIKRQTYVPGTEPGPSDWESSAPNTGEEERIKRQTSVPGIEHVPP